MQTKHFFDDPTHLVHTALHSLTLTNPSVALDLENKIIYRRPQKDAKPKVSIITGGGSGHEPGFAGFVGKVRPYPTLKSSPEVVMEADRDS